MTRTWAKRLSIDKTTLCRGQNVWVEDSTTGTWAGCLSSGIVPLSREQVVTTDKAQGADIVTFRQRKTAPVAVRRTHEKWDSTTKVCKISKQQYCTILPGAARLSSGTAALKKPSFQSCDTAPRCLEQEVWVVGSNTEPCFNQSHSTSLS